MIKELTLRYFLCSYESNKNIQCQNNCQQRVRQIHYNQYGRYIVVSFYGKFTAVNELPFDFIKDVSERIVSNDTDRDCIFIAVKGFFRKLGKKQKFVKKTGFDLKLPVNFFGKGVRCDQKHDKHESHNSGRPQICRKDIR